MANVDVGAVRRALPIFRDLTDSQITYFYPKWLAALPPADKLAARAKVEVAQEAKEHRLRLRILANAEDRTSNPSHSGRAKRTA